MSHAIERMRQEYIKSLVGRHVVRRRRQIETADMTEAEPEKVPPRRAAAPTRLRRHGRGRAMRHLQAERQTAKAKP